MVTSPDAQPQENKPLARLTTAQLEQAPHQQTRMTQSHTLLREWWRRRALRSRQGPNRIHRKLLWRRTGRTKNSPETHVLPPPRAAAVTYAHRHQTSPETERAHTRLPKITRRSGETDLRFAETETLTGPCQRTHHHATSRRRTTTASFSTNSMPQHSNQTHSNNEIKPQSGQSLSSLEETEPWRSNNTVL